MADAVLNSWKDIATHMHTSVRTAQRWEMHFELPIHRPSGTHKGPVLAFEKELDQWIHDGGAAAKAAAHNGHSDPAALPRRRHEDLMPRVRSAMERAERMRDLAIEINRRTQELSEQLAKALAMQAKKEPASRSSVAANLSPA